MRGCSLHCSTVLMQTVCSRHCCCTHFRYQLQQSASQSTTALAAGADDCGGSAATTGATLNSTVPAGGLAAQVAYRKPLKGEDPEVIYVQVTRLESFHFS
jgi:hypothetical protein